MFRKAGKLLIGFERCGGGAALFGKIRNKTQFVRITTSQRNGMVPMDLGIQISVALERRARAKTFDYRRVQGDVGPVENTIDIVPTLQSGQCIQSRE